MAFPDKNWLGIKRGWKDLGRIRPYHKEGDPIDYIRTPIHAFCHSKLHIGKEGERLFQFCPRCLVEIIEYT
jgi:hypothetical protein